MTARWFGEEIAFRTALEAGARRRYGRHLTVEILPDMKGDGHKPVPGPLVYRVDGVDVRGKVKPTLVEVRFLPVLPTPYRSLVSPEDYPKVFAESGAQSPHRFPDRSLCLYYPGDDRDLRWSADMGLEALLDMTAEHLYFEEYWRTHKKWLGAEAPHGFPS